MKKLDILREELKEALKRLEEALLEAKSELEIDGVIQRFEFSFELLWKTLKFYLEEQGLSCNSPKSCLQEAFSAKIIDHEKDWLSMLEDRNLSVHIYDRETSRKIFNNIKNSYSKLIEKAVKKIG